MVIVTAGHVPAQGRSTRNLRNEMTVEERERTITPEEEDELVDLFESAGFDLDKAVGGLCIGTCDIPQSISWWVGGGLTIIECYPSGDWEMYGHLTTKRSNDRAGMYRFLKTLSTFRDRLGKNHPVKRMSGTTNEEYLVFRKTLNDEEWQHWYATVYLKSDHWRKFKATISRDFCMRCEARRSWLSSKGFNLELHHLGYEHLFCETRNDVEVLCECCHDLQHQKPFHKTFRKTLTPEHEKLVKDAYEKAVGPPF